MPDGNVTWVRSWPDEGRPQFRIGRQHPDVLVAEWPGIARLRCARDGGSETVEVFAGLEDPIHAQKFYRGHVQALLRHLQGKLTLHASSVVWDGWGVGFFGGSGVGKSSLVAALCTRRKAAFVSDDALAWEVDGGAIRAFSLDLHNWLRPDMLAQIAMIPPHAHWKTPVEHAGGASGPVRLDALVHLVFDEAAAAPSLKRLQGQASFEHLSAATIRFVVDEDAVTLRDFDLLSRLASRVPVYELRRSLAQTSLEESIDLLAPLRTAHQ